MSDRLHPAGIGVLEGITVLVYCRHVAGAQETFVEGLRKFGFHEPCDSSPTF